MRQGELGGPLSSGVSKIEPLRVVHAHAGPGQACLWRFLAQLVLCWSAGRKIGHEGKGYGARKGKQVRRREKNNKGRSSRVGVGGAGEEESEEESKRRRCFGNIYGERKKSFDRGKVEA